MSINESDVKKIANLARLAINASEFTKYTHELSSILSFIGQMNEIDTKNIEPLAHPLNEIQPLRPDIACADIDRDYIQSIAPLVEAGLYLVPKVIE